jgi:PPK2 family polyphosphate:nucleotide phosphotransferase
MDRGACSTRSTIHAEQMGKSDKASLTRRLRVPRSKVRLADYDTSATPGFSGIKSDGDGALRALASTLADLQERLYANAKAGDSRSLLLVLQGMDTSGKVGTVRSAVGIFDPQGVQLKSFKAPTPVERKHDFLWRIEKEVPAAGMVGIFDRSHDEDVLIARVRKLAPAKEIERRYRAINEFEARLAASGTVIVKCMLHIFAAEQRKRLRARLDDPTKHWKFNPGDIDERALWSDYQRAYELALDRCNTDAAPWLVVPSDKKWYRNWAVARVLLEALEALGLAWPKGTFDVDEQKQRLAAT